MSDTALRPVHIGTTLRGLAVALASAVLLFGIVAYPKAIEFDSLRGILAADQYSRGNSPSPVHLVSVDPSNLAGDVIQPESWRAPLYQLVPYALVASGLTWGQALRAVVLCALTAGLIGWLLLYRAVLRSLQDALTLVLLTLLSAGISSHVVQYNGGNLLLWALAPWMVLSCHVALAGHPTIFRVALALLAGLLCTGVYFVKYSGLFIGIGLAAGWAVVALQRWSQARRQTIAFAVGAALGASALVPWTGLAGPNPVSATGSGLRIFEAIAAFGAWPMAMTDLAGPVQWLALKAGSQFQSARLAVPLVGLAVLAGLLALGRAWARERGGDLVNDDRGLRPLVLLILGAVVADTVLYSSTIVTGGDVEVSARLARITGALLLPFAFAVITGSTRSGVLPRRVLAASLGLCLFGAAPMFGSYVLMARMADTAGRQAVGSRSDVRLTMFRNVDASALSAELDGLVPSRSTALYVTYPEILLERPAQRFMLVYVLDRELSSEQLSDTRYKGTPSDGVAALLPDSLNADGRAAAILNSFTEVNGWSHTALASAPGWSVWRSAAAQRVTAVSGSAASSDD